MLSSRSGKFLNDYNYLEIKMSNRYVMFSLVRLDDKDSVFHDLESSGVVVGRTHEGQKLCEKEPFNLHCFAQVSSQEDVNVLFTKLKADSRVTEVYVPSPRYAL